MSAGKFEQTFAKRVKSMKANPKSAFVAMVAVLAMTACGGSSDDGAGQISAFQVSPDAITLNSGDDFCPATDSRVADVQVVGGTAPYRVTSSQHLAITFGPAGSTAPTTQGSYTVSNRNGQFAVFVTGCLDLPITVLDDLGRLATVQITAASGSGS
ncbi:MAG: hypothetical protein H7Z15_18430 [Rhizobacter sp.]|nr:hypothetical protein [Rhizobacter sp.]